MFEFAYKYVGKINNKIKDFPQIDHLLNKC